MQDTTTTTPTPPRVAGFPSLGTHLLLVSLSVLCLSHYPMHVSAPRGSLKKSLCVTPLPTHPLQPPLVSRLSSLPLSLLGRAWIDLD